MNDDGISLCSRAHPSKSRWWMRLWWFFVPPKLSPDSLETVEINIREPDLFVSPQQARILHRLRVQPFERLHMNDQEIERELQAKGKTAPRVTPEQVEACIAYEFYTTANSAFKSTVPVIGPAYKSMDYAHIMPLSCLTLCVLMLRNGFTVTGESACASPDNFDEALGRKIARQKAIDKVCMLEGYLLKERLHRDAINRSSGGGDFGDS